MTKPTAHREWTLICIPHEEGGGEIHVRTLGKYDKQYFGEQHFDVIEMSAVQDLLDALEGIIPYAENGAPKPSHVGSCTPETNCDMDCSNAFHAANAFYKAQTALTKFREGKSNG